MPPKYRIRDASGWTMFIFGILAMLLGLAGLLKPELLLTLLGFTVLDRATRVVGDYTLVFLIASSMAVRLIVDPTPGRERVRRDGDEMSQEDADYEAVRRAQRARGVELAAELRAEARGKLVEQIAELCSGDLEEAEHIARQLGEGAISSILSTPKHKRRHALARHLERLHARTTEARDDAP